MAARRPLANDAPPDTSPGPNETKAFVTRFLADYPDMQVRIEDVIAENNKVVVRNIWRGTHQETGDKFHQMGIVILHFDKAGQITERWSAYTRLVD